MRRTLREALHRDLGQRAPDHVGLAYDVWAETVTASDSDDFGKVASRNGERDKWLARIVRNAKVPEGYREAFAAWKAGFAADGSRTMAIELTSRLLLGHGNPAPTEVGLTVHHTWGVPVIPGSAIKGLLNHYLDAIYGTDEPRWRGVGWFDGRPVQPPGDWHRRLFGGPDVDGDDFDLGVAAATRGAVVFHDALWIPPHPKADDPPFLAPDVITVHQKTFYNHAGEKGGPNDYDAPNPISFLTVRPGARFLIALSGPSDLTQLALEGLIDALEEWGIGSKTAAGYGRAKSESGARDQTAGGGGTAGMMAAQNPAAKEFLEFLHSKDPLPGATDRPTQQDKLIWIEENWLERLKTLVPQDKEAVIAAMARVFDSPKPARKAHLRAVTDKIRG